MSGEQNKRTTDNGEDIPYHRNKAEDWIYPKPQPGSWNGDDVVQDVREGFRLYFFSSDWLHPKIVPYISGRCPSAKGHVTFESQNGPHMEQRNFARPARW